MTALVIAAVLNRPPAALAAAAGSADEGGADCAAVAPPDLRRICEQGELRVARYRGERPPFFFHRDGEAVGFDVDLARDVAARLGVSYREMATAESFDAVVEMVASGRADVGISKLSATLGRARKVRFTGPYLTVYQALLVNRLSVPGGGDPFRVLDAPGFVIGALAGSAYVGFAEASFRRAEVRPYREFAAMMGEVIEGRIDAALLDSARADTWRRGHREQLIRVRTTVDKTRKDPLAIAVAWEDGHLLAWLELYLETIEADGTAGVLYRRWFGEAGAAAAAGAEDGAR